MDIKKTIMQRDNLTSQEADAQIKLARNDLLECLDNGEMPYDICNDWFGLEPDYIEDLI